MVDDVDHFAYAVKVSVGDVNSNGDVRGVQKGRRRGGAVRECARARACERAHDARWRQNAHTVIASISDVDVFNSNCDTRGLAKGRARTRAVRKRARPRAGYGAHGACRRCRTDATIRRICDVYDPGGANRDCGRVVEGRARSTPIGVATHTTPLHNSRAREWGRDASG